MSDAIIAACCTALPGGALVQSGAQLGARVGYALASGERIDRAALKALKDALPEDAHAAFVATGERAGRRWRRPQEGGRERHQHGALLKSRVGVVVRSPTLPML